MFNNKVFRIHYLLKNKTVFPHLQLVCNQYDGFSLELLLNALFKNVFPYVGVNSRQRVVEEEDVLVGVDGSGHADPLLLPP